MPLDRVPDVWLTSHSAPERGLSGVWISPRMRRVRTTGSAPKTKRLHLKGAESSPAQNELTVREHRIRASFLSSANLALAFSQALSCGPLALGGPERDRRQQTAKSQMEV